MDNPNTKYTITHGERASQSQWADVRTYSWDELCALMVTHKPGSKDGFCFTPAVFRGSQRKKDNAEQIDLLVLDCDTGEPLEYICDAISKQRWQAIIYSTHSHGMTETEVRRVDWEKGKYAGPEQYLIEVKGLNKLAAAGARIKNLESEDTLTFEHQPCPKFRIVLPLKMPWRAADFPSQGIANEYWASAVLAVSRTLGLQHDQSCTDTSRLYYFPRHPDGAAFVTKVIDGDPCDLTSIDISFIQTKKSRKDHLATGDTHSYVYRCGRTGQKINLQKWQATEGKIFDIVLALRNRKPDVFTGYVADNRKHHIRCVNEASHTKQGPDASCFIASPVDSDTGAFVYCCMHAHCKGKDRLEFLSMMLEAGWLLVEDLYPDGLPLTYEEICNHIAALDKNYHPDDVDVVIKEIERSGLGPLQEDKLLSLIKTQTGISVRSLRQTVEQAKQKQFDDVPRMVSGEVLRRFFNDGEHLIFAEDGSFWEFVKTHWKVIRNEQLEKRILQIIEAVVAPKQENFCSVMKQALALLRGMQAVDGDFFQMIGGAPSVINCLNGELWLDDAGTVELKPHSPKSYLTYVLDVIHDPAAVCPKFDAALLDTFASSSDPGDMARHLIELMGYTIQPSRFLSCWAMFYGGGHNGKTCIAQTMQKLMSSSAVYCGRIEDIEKNRFTIGSLLGKLLVVDDDVDTGTRLPDGFMKRLSEQKMVSGEKKFKNSFEFTATVLILLLANNYPITADISVGMTRRAMIVPFARRFTAADKDDGLYPYIWKHEMSGVLNRLIEGLRRLKQRGAFSEPVDCVEARREWLRHANPLPAFLEEYCVHDPNTSVTLQYLLASFKMWMENENIRYSPSSQTLRKNMENLGYTCRRTGGAWRIEGLRAPGAISDTGEEAGSSSI